MKKEIESLITVEGITFTVCPKGRFQKEGCWEGVWIDECSIKHLGNQIYLVGYFNYGKNGGGIMGEQNRINQYEIIFPSKIARVIFK